MIIQRRFLRSILDGLGEHEIILISAPPRAGKSSLAAQLKKALGTGAILAASGSPVAQALLSVPGQGIEKLLSPSADILIVDDARREDLAFLLKAIEARGAEEPPRKRFVLLGGPFGAPTSAPPRILMLELRPFGLDELGSGSKGLHWLRGGFPEAALAASDREAFSWLSSYAESFSSSRFASIGLPWAPGRHRALLSMLAEAHGGAFNENEAARSLGVSRPTVVRALEALAACGIVRFLPVHPAPRGRRQRRAPTILFRDTGLLHALRGVSSMEGLLGSVKLASSWAAYGIEEGAKRLRPELGLACYPVGKGSGIDLLITAGEAVLAGAVFRFHRAHVPERSLIQAAQELHLSRVWMVYPGAEDMDREQGVIKETGISSFLAALERL